MTQIEWFTAAVLFVLGGCVGSFLNVVIYRLPRTMNLLRPASSCPNCGHAIRFKHNVPIFGWFVLRGRCHDCGEKISPRYPLIEAATAVAFVLLAAGLFLRADKPPIEALADGRLWTVYASAVALFSTLLATIAIYYDGQRVPKILPAIGLAALVFLVMLLK